MKKKTLLKRTFAILLSAIAFASFGCAKTETTNEEVKNVTFVGVHDFEAKETANWLVKDGTTDYIVVVPSSQGEYMQTAQNEFVYLFALATGITLRVVYDTGLTHKAENKYISLGQTSLLQSAGITYEKEKLGNDGVKIVTKDNTVFLFGANDYGTLYAVYDFMQMEFNYDTYARDCMDIDTGVKNLKLKDYQVTDIPDMPWRPYNHGTYYCTYSDYDKKNYAKRMRVVEPQREFMACFYDGDESKPGARATTNTDTILPRVVYLSDTIDGEPNPKYNDNNVLWFSDNGNQWCYTAHGNEVELERMTNQVTHNLVQSLKVYTKESSPEKNVLTVTMEDNHDVCTCASCNKMNKEYGTQSAAVCIFMNMVGEKVEAWMNEPENEEYKRDDLVIIFFAYNEFINAPAKFNEKTEKYEPIDEKVKLRDNIGVYYASIRSNYQQGLYSKEMEAYRNNTKAWCSLTENMYHWTYSNNFRYEFYLYDSFNFFTSEAYQFIAAANAKSFYNQMKTYFSGPSLLATQPTTWDSLKLYLDSKLAWNSSLDSAELIDKYFKGVYGDVAPMMRSLFNDIRLHVQTEYTRVGFNGSGETIYCHVNKPEIWPLATLNSWIERFDLALVAAEKYKTSQPERYEQICQYIEIEATSILYIKLSLYTNKLSPLERQGLIARLKRDCDWCDVGNLRLSAGSQTLKEWLETL